MPVHVDHAVADGSFDSTFNDDGWNAFNPTPRFDVATDLAMHDGDAIGAGSASDDANTLVFRVKRNEPF